MAAGDEFITAVGKWRARWSRSGATRSTTQRRRRMVRSFIATEAPTVKGHCRDDHVRRHVLANPNVDILTNSSGGGVFGSASGERSRSAGWVARIRAGTSVHDPINHRVPAGRLFARTSSCVSSSRPIPSTASRTTSAYSIAPGETCAYEVVVKLAPFYGSGIDGVWQSNRHPAGVSGLRMRGYEFVPVLPVEEIPSC
jgi:hypothetical protein